MRRPLFTPPLHFDLATDPLLIPSIASRTCLFAGHLYHDVPSECNLPDPAAAERPCSPSRGCALTGWGHPPVHTVASGPRSTAALASSITTNAQERSCASTSGFLPCGACCSETTNVSALFRRRQSFLLLLPRPFTCLSSADSKCSNCGAPALPPPRPAAPVGLPGGECALFWFLWAPQNQRRPNSVRPQVNRPDLPGAPCVAR